MSLLTDLLILVPKLSNNITGSKHFMSLPFIDVALIASQELQKPLILSLRSQGAPAEQIIEESERYLKLSNVGIKGQICHGKVKPASQVYSRVREMVEGL